MPTIDELDWFTFPDGRHPPLHPCRRPATSSRSRRATSSSGSRSTAGWRPQSGLPVVLIQGYKMLGDAIERHAFEAPCPKVCVAGWLVERRARAGRAGERARPRSDRHPPRPVPGHAPDRDRARCGSPSATARMRRRAPSSPSTSSGGSRTPCRTSRWSPSAARPPEHTLPPWVTYVTQPSPAAARRRDLQHEPRVPLHELGRGVRPAERRGDGLRRGARHDRQRRLTRLRVPRRDRPGGAATAMSMR